MHLRHYLQKTITVQDVKHSQLGLTEDARKFLEQGQTVEVQYFNSIPPEGKSLKALQVRYHTSDHTSDLLSGNNMIPSRDIAVYKEPGNMYTLSEVINTQDRVLMSSTRIGA